MPVIEPPDYLPPPPYGNATDPTVEVPVQPADATTGLFGLFEPIAKIVLPVELAVVTRLHVGEADVFGPDPGSEAPSPRRRAVPRHTWPTPRPGRPR